MRRRSEECSAFVEEEDAKMGRGTADSREQMPVI